MQNAWRLKLAKNSHKNPSIHNDYSSEWNNRTDHPLNLAQNILLDVTRKCANGKQWIQIHDVNCSCSGGQSIFQSIKCFKPLKNHILKWSWKNARLCFCKSHIVKSLPFQPKVKQKCVKQGLVKISVVTLLNTNFTSRSGFRAKIIKPKDALAIPVSKKGHENTSIRVYLYLVTVCSSVNWMCKNHISRHSLTWFTLHWTSLHSAEGTVLPSGGPYIPNHPFPLTFPPLLYIIIRQAMYNTFSCKQSWYQLLDMRYMQHKAYRVILVHSLSIQSVLCSHGCLGKWGSVSSHFWSTQMYRCISVN